jgi:hypothetical protein
VPRAHPRGDRHGNRAVAKRGLRGRVDRTHVRRRIDRAEEPPVVVAQVAALAPEGINERPGDADAVLEHLEAAVPRGPGKWQARTQVQLVGGMDDRAPEDRPVPLLPRLDERHSSGGLFPRVHPHPRLGVVAREAERHHGYREQLGEVLEETVQRGVEHVTVVHAGAQHHLGVGLDPVVEQLAQPPQARSPALVAQHLCPAPRLRCVDAHVERGQPLLHHALQVGLGETGERGEVPVEEAQPVVVVLRVQAAAHALRQLVDEAELAVVVTGVDAVEHGARHGRAEGLPCTALDLDVDGHPSAVHRERHGVLLHEALPLDDVPRRDAVHGEHHVALLQARAGGGGGRVHTGHDRCLVDRVHRCLRLSLRRSLA